MKKLSAILGVAFALCFTQAANATIMTLEFDDTSTGTSYTEAGMTITATSAEPVRVNGGAWRLDCCDSAAETFSLSTGGVFDLLSVFRVHVDYSDPIYWTGYSNGVEVVSTSYNTGQGSDFNFVGFTGLDLVTMSVSGNWTDPAFDNLTYQSVSVPEPTSIALLSLAFFGMTAARKRK